MTRAPLPSAHPIIGFADEARRDSACDSRSGALEQNRNIAAWRERRWRPSRDAFARRKSAPRREGMQDLQRAGQTNPRVWEERTVWAERTRGACDPLPRVKFWPNGPERLRESHDLAKRTRGGANGRCGVLGEIEALYLGGKIHCSFCCWFTMRPKLYI